MDNIELFNNTDMELLENNINKISKNARLYALNNKLEPNLDEYNNVLNIILNYIKENKRIIYGGQALNNLILSKNINDKFYDNIDRPDIEFYSFEPIKDIVKLGNILYDNNFKFVRGEEAQHHETYKLHINFLTYCDITYMPKYIFNNIKTINVNNLLYPHQNFLYIDLLRMYNDPITSYWRIQKFISRSKIFFKYYKLNLKSEIIINKISIIEKNILDFIRKKIISKSDLILLGYYSYEYYVHKATNLDKEIYVPYYDVISTNIYEDSKEIYKKLNEYNNEITVEEYHKFFQFLDKRICFKYKNKILLNIYGNNGKCIPYNYLDSKEVKISSFMYLIMILLIKSIQFEINKDKEFLHYNYMIKNLLKVKKDYLIKNNNTILDETVFKDFIIKCIGDTIEFDREYRLKIQDKLNKKKRLKFTYDPLKDRERINLYLFKYDNSSGNKNESNNKILNI